MYLEKISKLTKTQLYNERNERFSNYNLAASYNFRIISYKQTNKQKIKPRKTY
jgi:hypothetical protein